MSPLVVDTPKRYIYHEWLHRKEDAIQHQQQQHPCPYVGVRSAVFGLGQHGTWPMAEGQSGLGCRHGGPTESDGVHAQMGTGGWVTAAATARGIMHR